MSGQSTQIQGVGRTLLSAPHMENNAYAAT